MQEKWNYYIFLNFLLHAQNILCFQKIKTFSCPWDDCCDFRVNLCVVQNGAFLGCTPVTLLYCSVLDELMHHVLKTLLLVANWKPFLHCFMDQCSRASHYGTAELGIYLALLHCTCLTFIDIGILENSSAVSISIVTILVRKKVQRLWDHVIMRAPPRFQEKIVPIDFFFPIL